MKRLRLAIVSLLLTGCGTILGLDETPVTTDASSDGGAGTGGGAGAGTGGGAGAATGDAGGEAGQDAGVDVVATECSLEGLSGPCSTCLQSQCGDTCFSCSQDDQCRALLLCIEDCRTSGAAGCIPVCVDPLGPPEGIWPELLACAAETCASACPELIEAPVSQCVWEMRTPTCTSCVQSNCESDCVSLQEQSDYADYTSCLDSCDGVSTPVLCLQGCDTDFPNAAQAYSAFTQCIDAECGAACADDGCLLATNDPSCDDCLHEQCLLECITASADVDLPAALDCWSNCSDQNCLDACEALYPSASSALMALEVCLQQSCATSC